MTRQEIRQTIVDCAARLKHVPSLRELINMSAVSHRQIYKNFGGYINALRDTGLELKSTIGRGHGVPLEKLLDDWARVVRKLKKLPSINEYNLLSQYAPSTLMGRFGTWRQVPNGLRKFAETQGLARRYKHELALVKPPAKAGHPSSPRSWPGLYFDRPCYGMPLFPGPMVFGPTNELGVIFLFGALAAPLGFTVHRLQSGFPDCEATQRTAPDNCRFLRIEFEFESRNFLRHMHDPAGCDMIVCWRHNWPECPLEVVELSREIARLAQRAV